MTIEAAGTEETLAKAQAFVTRERLVNALRLLVDTASPTGEEGPLARKVVKRLRNAGIDAREQALDARQSNALGVLPGAGTGPSLLLHSPLDTVTANNAEEDLPWAGAELRSDMQSKSRLEGDFLFGLGAQNPKGHAACVLVAGEALQAAQTPLAGSLRLGFGAGGMPTDARPGMRSDSGHGIGCQAMLRHEVHPDAAVTAKSGWSVSWEEVGLAWFDVRVFGTHTYVGSRHLLPYRNAIAEAGRLIERLEAWFPIWAERHRSGLVAPQGVVSQIEGGWARMPAFTPAECRFKLDLRVSPRTSKEEVEAQFGAFLAKTSQELDIDCRWRCTRFIPGTHSAPEQAIIRTCISAWEAETQRLHRPVRGLSGATDANILRMAGIPTARVGLPKADLPDIDFQLGMNAVRIQDMMRLTRLLIRVAVDFCGLEGGHAQSPPRKEVDLRGSEDGDGHG